jgi:hypothetical protein
LFPLYLETKIKNKKCHNNLNKVLLCTRTTTGTKMGTFERSA